MQQEAASPMHQTNGEDLAAPLLEPTATPTAKPAAGVRRILRQSRPEWPAMAAATICLVLAVLLQAVMPILFGRMIDATSDTGGSRRARMRAYSEACLELAGIVGVSLFFTAVRAYVFNSAGAKVVARLRVLLFRSMLAQETSWFDVKETGDLLSRLASDTQKLQAAATETVSLALRSAISAAISFALLFYTSWRLASLATAVVPFLIGATFIAMRVVKRLAKESQAALARAGAVAQEGLANQRVVRSFGAESFEVSRYAHAVGDPDADRKTLAKDSSLALGLRQAGVQAAFITMTAGLGYASVLGVWYYGGLLVVRGQMTTGDLVAFVMLLLTITASLSVLAQTGASVVEAVGASVEIFAVIDREPEIPNEWASKSDDDRATELKLVTGAAAGCAFENVVFSYASRPDLRVLDGLTFSIPAKARAALVGPSGGGKTTLLHLLERFYDVPSGKVLFDGIDVRAIEPSLLRTKMALVAQQPALFSGSIRDNIAYASRARGLAVDDAAVEAAARAAHAFDFTTAFPDGFETTVGERGVRLSGGQTQRVAIARALLAAPRLLLFDEATSALDAESEALVQDAIDALCVGRTSISVAHRLSTVVNADVIALVQGGRVLGSGTHDVLLRDCPEYANLVRRQLRAADSSASLA